MNSICSVDIGSIASGLGSRKLGMGARDVLLDLLEHNGVVEIDFHHRSFTPSFADGCLGQLAARMGLADFKRRVKLLNTDEATRPLIRHVVLTRCAQASSQVDEGQHA